MNENITLAKHYKLNYNSIHSEVKKKTLSLQTTGWGKHGIPNHNTHDESLTG